MKLMKSQLKVKPMILFRVLAVFIGIYAFYLYSFRFGVGMIPIWLILFVISLFLSFQKTYDFVFGNNVLKLVFILGVTFLMIVEVVIFYSGVKTDIQEESDYIIVLGASVKGERPSLTLRRRIQKAEEYLDLHEDTKAILSGGQGPGEDITEAEAMRRYLVEHGIDENRLILEEQSTSTMENIKFSYQLIKNDYGNVTDVDVIVISSRFHLLRSQIIANKQGHEVKAIGSTTLIYLVPNYYLREFFGIFYELFR